MGKRYIYWQLYLLLICWSTAASAVEKNCSEEAGLRSLAGDRSTQITFVNRRSEPIYTYWLNYQGRRVFYAEVAAGQSYIQQTYVTHPWVVATRAGDCLRIFMPEKAPIKVRVP
jgi:hypothetical protein